MDSASEALFALKPVTFRYKKDIDPQGIPQLVADLLARTLQCHTSPSSCCKTSKPPQ
jgi:hypothetical protein